MLIAKEVTREYRSGDQQLAVLKDVSFTIPQGAFVAIVGPSGSGKTTLLGLLAGLDTPTRGQVIVSTVLASLATTGHLFHPAYEYLYLQEAYGYPETEIYAALWQRRYRHPEKGPDPQSIPGLLEVTRIDGLHHYVVLDQDEDFAEFLRGNGARSVQSMPVSLDRAVNSFLAKNHAAPSAA